jgi:hypothetical protein
MEQLVLPRKKQHPTHIRLDGQTTGSSQRVFGRFKRNGKSWKVHEDTRYEPLKIAYDAEMAGGNPFCDPKATETGKGICIELTPDLWHKRYKYLYIYLDGE